MSTDGLCSVRPPDHHFRGADAARSVAVVLATLAAVARPVGDDAGEADHGDEGACGVVDEVICAAEVFEIETVHFLGGGGEGGDGTGFKGKRAVLCGRGDVVDGRWFTAHVQRGFSGDADDLIESSEELGVLGWKYQTGGYGTEGESATSGRRSGWF